MKLLTSFYWRSHSIAPNGLQLNEVAFKEQMKQDIIPFVERMIEKEKEHLYWLESKKAPQEFIERSKWHLNHFRQRHKEYIEYAEGL